MNGGRILLGVLLVLVLVGLVAGASWYGYNVGVSQGLANGDRVAPPTNGTQVAPFVAPYGFAPYGFYRPFGFGFGFLGCLFPLLFLFLIFGLFRFAIFGPRWRRGWYGPRGGWDTSKSEIPQGLKDLHQKLHDQDAGSPPPATPTGA